MSNAHGYGWENYLGQLPRVLSEDENLYALAYAIARAFAVRLGELPLEQIYTRIDELPEQLLDILARDFNVEWYNFDYPEEAKRNLIKSCYYVHRHLGTVGAFMATIRDLYPRSDVEEWFDYDGEPYHFRILLEAGDPIIPFDKETLLRTVELFKSLRSHLDEVAYRTKVCIGIGEKGNWAWCSPPLTDTLLCGVYPAQATT